jgi:hypothetical protein
MQDYWLAVAGCFSCVFVGSAVPSMMMMGSFAAIGAFDFPL